jgi:Tfp pilus assembly protein PilF
MKDSQGTDSAADAETELSVARAFIESGRPDKALYELKALLEKEPKNTGAHTMVGLAQMALKNPKKAVEHLKIAWDLEPSAQNALNLSSAYLQANQLESAQKIIVKGLATKENPPYRHKERFYHNLALIAQIKGKASVAEKALRKALEENPTFYMSRQQLAVMLGKAGKLEAAKEQWELARIACPLCLEPTEQLTRYYQAKGDLRTALGLISDFKKLEGINPTEAKRVLELESELNTVRTKLAKQAAADAKSR